VPLLRRVTYALCGSSPLTNLSPKTNSVIACNSLFFASLKGIIMPTLQFQDVLLFGVPITLSASTLFWMHFFPWNKGTRPLGYIARYSMGTTCVVGFPVIAMLVADAMQMPHDERWWASHLIANVAVSGLTVMLAYWIDSNRAVTAEEAGDNGRL
jgi:hypothetical protein